MEANLDRERGRIATDVGGTFTDMFYVKNGQAISLKYPSTPDGFEKGVMEALHRSDVDFSSVESFVHGSTVVINALTERKGVKTGLVTTKGFRDVLEIARGNTPDIFNNQYRKPRPFIPRYLRVEVQERVDHAGEVIAPLDEEETRRLTRQLLQDGVRAIAVCFLHSYANPNHERRVVDLIKQIDPSIDVIASHEVCRQWREYERTSTAVLSAYVLPVTHSYLNSLQNSLRDSGLTSTIQIMQSNGGMTTASTASTNPIAMIESGPVAGIQGAADYGRKIGHLNLITLDIGGTTAKCSLIHDGEVRVSTDYYIEKSPITAGYPICTPVVDIVEIGNGGGSVAWLDKANSMHVGPQSAGAVPGPIAYGRGGIQPTTTDAHLLLGRIDRQLLAGGAEPPDISKVTQGFTKLADKLGVEPLDVALGTVRIANANMVNALKLVSVNRGYDPREFVLIAFGGGAGLHASSLAKELEIAKVIIPPHSAVFSAWSMLTLNQRRDEFFTCMRRLDNTAVQWINDTFAAMERDTRRELLADTPNVTDAELSCQHHLDARYAGQEHSVEMVFHPLDDDVAMLENRFHDTHEQEFSFRLDNPIEIVNFHLVVVGPPPQLQTARNGRVRHADLSVTKACHSLCLL